MKKAKMKNGDPVGTKPAKGGQPKEGEGKRGRGRPTKYHQVDIAQAEKLGRYGLTNDEMADFFGIARSTFQEYLKEYPEFSDAVKRGKVVSNSNMVESLYHRGMGYSHPEDKIFLHEGQPVIVPTIKRYPPDTAAAFIYLKNRMGWTDKKEVSGEIKIDRPDLSKLSSDELETLLALREKMGVKSE